MLNTQVVFVKSDNYIDGLSTSLLGTALKSSTRDVHVRYRARLHNNLMWYWLGLEIPNNSSKDWDRVHTNDTSPV